MGTPETWERGGCAGRGGTHMSRAPHLSPLFAGEVVALFWQLSAGKYWLKPKTRRLTHSVLTNTGRGPQCVWGAASPRDGGALHQGGGTPSWGGGL